MILDRLVKLGFGISKVAMETTAKAIPVAAVVAKKSYDFVEAEVVNAKTAYDESSLEEQRQHIDQSVELSEMIIHSENDMIKKPTMLED